MNNLSTLGLISCFLFTMALNGTSLTHLSHNEPASSAYITNNSPYTIYFKPESRKSNPGLDPYAAYAIVPGESYNLPFDAVVTPMVQGGKIYRLPTGSRIVIDKNGNPIPANFVARVGALLSAYGEVSSPCVQFAKLANPKATLYLTNDVCNVR